MEGLILHKKFSEIDLNDPFFDSLKEDYPGFEEWFNRKSGERAYVLYNQESKLDAFLYLKIEQGPIHDVNPPLLNKRLMKIGTFKINPHGTRLGERFIKKALDSAVYENVEGIYVTAFPKHDVLIELFLKYGFIKLAEKESSNGTELVFWKTLKEFKSNVLLDYPRLSQRGKGKYLLSIFPEFHTRLFPDSILRNERFDAIEDVSHTNSIHKVFISSAPVSRLQSEDIIIIYRTSDGVGPAKYRSVATSICVVEALKSKSEFKDQQEFVDYCRKFSVYSVDELKELYEKKKRLYVIKMTYNVALRKRVTRERLINEVGIDPSDRWTFIEITDNQFDTILMAGDSHESLVVD
jgi:hypothetical protein